MPDKIKSSRRQRIIKVFEVLGGAVFGAFLHAAAVKDVTISLAVAACLIVACALGLLLLQFSIAERVDLEIDKIDSALQRTDGIRDSVVQIMRQERMTVHYYRASDQPDGYQSGYQRIYDEAMKAVCEAECSIHTLTSYLLDKDPADPHDRDGKQKYFDGLLAHVKSNPKIDYFRVLQYEGDKKLDEIADIQYGRHYLEADNLQRANVVLKRMKGTRPTTFVIVDETTLLWQINAVQGQSGMRMLGMFIIVDPAKVITRHFIEEFKEYWNKRSDTFDVQETFARFKAIRS